MTCLELAEARVLLLDLCCVLVLDALNTHLQLFIVLLLGRPEGMLVALLLSLHVLLKLRDFLFTVAETIT